MERIITRFVTALRERGVRVSPGESLDAVQALAIGGLSGRSSVKALLRLTLVKNVNDIPAFEEVFDWFFSSNQSNPGDLDPAEFLSAMIHIVEGEQLKADEHRTREKDDPLQIIDEDLTAEDLENLLGLEESDDDAAGAEIMVQLDGYRGKMNAPEPADYYMQSPPTVAFHQGVNKSRVVPFTPEELADMQEVVSRMLVRIRKDVQRMKEMENRGKLHVIKTIQKNYRHGMVPFLLSLRRKRKEKPRLVVLCDVSYSVSHATRFMLLLLHTLQNRLMHVRSFIFNKELAEITPMLRNMPVNCLLETIDKGDIINLDDNSDYGAVFASFKERHLENMRGKPAIIIIGDGRNNYNEANDWALEEIREKAGYMLWLTPEERDIWQRGDCLLDLYGSYCDRVETARDVDELSRLVEDLFHTLFDHNDSRAWKRDRHEPRVEEPAKELNYYNRPKAVDSPNCTQFSPSSKEWRDRYGTPYHKRR
ncbi:VWA domain containing CoxE-like protein [Geobacter sp. OR-1]|uniref:VWA domain-containing protein n=1 Tax=Geobacter sp. OR-1 TaxID=1266765 RepID=UPI000543E03D|nr:VWA domain-containing protein [Geobacter sp. OR-1]GAM11475.1 VWA domain containing CoxE-like protein [Geobacter sp. OR-1]